MSVDLTLLPMRPPQDGYRCATIVLPLLDCAGIRSQIASLPSEPVDWDLYTYFENPKDDSDAPMGITTEDRYGEPLRYVTVHALRSLYPASWSHLPQNISAWEYLARLPDTWPVVLYWD